MINHLNLLSSIMFANICISLVEEVLSYLHVLQSCVTFGGITEAWQCDIIFWVRQEKTVVAEGRMKN